MYVPGEYFGELALFDDEPRSASASAIDECSLYFLSRAAFRSFLETHPAALLSCLEVIVGQLRQCTDLADEIALLDVRKPAGAPAPAPWPTQGVLESERAQPAGTTSYRITQQQLANMMGATRESVNKHLNGFVDEGMIRLERGHIHVLDFKKLEACSIGLISKCDTFHRYRRVAGL